MPESAAYRRYTEQLVRERLALVEAEKDPASLETKIGAGQLEQVIRQVSWEYPEPSPGKTRSPPPFSLIEDVYL